jgi:hypothetical protein
MDASTVEGVTGRVEAGIDASVPVPQTEPKPESISIIRPSASSSPPNRLPSFSSSPNPSIVATDVAVPVQVGT